MFNTDPLNHSILPDPSFQTAHTSLPISSPQSEIPQTSQPVVHSATIKDLPHLDPSLPSAAAQLPNLETIDTMKESVAAAGSLEVSTPSIPLPDITAYMQLALSDNPQDKNTFHQSVKTLLESVSNLKRIEGQAAPLLLKAIILELSKTPDTKSKDKGKPLHELFTYLSKDCPAIKEKLFDLGNIPPTIAHRGVETLLTSRTVGMNNNNKPQLLTIAQFDQKLQHFKDGNKDSGIYLVDYAGHFMHVSIQRTGPNYFEAFYTDSLGSEAIGYQDGIYASISDKLPGASIYMMGPKRQHSQNACSSFSIEDSMVALKQPKELFDEMKRSSQRLTIGKESIEKLESKKVIFDSAIKELLDLEEKLPKANKENQKASLIGEIENLQGVIKENKQYIDQLNELSHFLKETYDLAPSDLSFTQAELNRNGCSLYICQQIPKDLLPMTEAMSLLKKSPHYKAGLEEQLADYVMTREKYFNRSYSVLKVKDPEKRINTFSENIVVNDMIKLLITAFQENPPKSLDDDEEVAEPVSSDDEAAEPVPTDDEV